MYPVDNPVTVFIRCSRGCPFTWLYLHLEIYAMYGEPTQHVCLPWLHPLLWGHLWLTGNKATVLWRAVSAHLGGTQWVDTQGRMSLTYHVSGHHFGYDVGYSLPKVSLPFSTSQNPREERSMNSIVKKFMHKLTQKKLSLSSLCKLPWFINQKYLGAVSSLRAL